MGKLTILALRIVIAMVLAGSLFVQVWMVPLVSADLIEAGALDVCGASVIIAGVALIVLVMRTLLAQAVAPDAEAKHLRSELDEVIRCPSSSIST